LALEQGGYDWGVLAYVGFGGSMIWFGSSSGGPFRICIRTRFGRCGQLWYSRLSWWSRSTRSTCPPRSARRFAAFLGAIDLDVVIQFPLAFAREGLRQVMVELA
jgi:hypothetical protein